MFPHEIATKKDFTHIQIYMRKIDVYNSRSRAYDANFNSVCYHMF